MSLVGLPLLPPLVVGDRPAGGSDECGWWPGWPATLTLVAHACWVSHPPHGAASLLPAAADVRCCCLLAGAGTGAWATAVAGRASQWAAPASVGGGRVRLSARTPAAPACCVLASVSVALLLSLFVTLLLFITLLLRACTCGSSTKIVLLQVSCRLGHARVRSCCWPPWGCTKGGGWAGGAGCCPPWPSVESVLWCGSTAPE